MIVTMMVAMLAIGAPDTDVLASPTSTGRVELAQGEMQVGVGIGEIAMATQDSGLPERLPPPRTMRDYWPVFALFSVVWLGIVGYVLTFNGRLKRMASRLGGLPGGEGTP